MRRKDGLPLDEMASEMGFDDDTAFLEAVKSEYPRVKGKKKRSWTAGDFMELAEDQVWAAMDAGMVSGLRRSGVTPLGQDLFPGLKREAALKTDGKAHLSGAGSVLSAINALYALSRAGV